MPSTLTLLKDFAGGQGGGIGTYTAYASDHDGNYTNVEDCADQVKTELDAIGGNVAALLIDLLLANAPGGPTVSEGRMGNHAYSASLINTTQVEITEGKFLIGSDSITLTADKALTGSGSAGNRFVALQADGDVFLESLASQGVKDIYQLSWDGAAWDTSFGPDSNGIQDNTEVLVDADDFQDALTVVGSVNAGPPEQTHQRFADRFENLERIMRADLGNIQALRANPSGAALNPMAFGGTAGAVGFMLGNGTIFETDSGFYRAAVDHIAAAIQGTQAWALDPQGNQDLPTQSRVRTRRAAVQNLASNTTGALITFDTEDEDVGGWFTASSTNHTVPSGADGSFDITAHVVFDESSSATPNAGGLRAVEISAGGTLRRAALGPVTTTNEDTSFPCVFNAFPLVATQVVTVRAIQDSGNAMDITATLEIKKSI